MNLSDVKTIDPELRERMGSFVLDSSGKGMSFFLTLSENHWMITSMYVEKIGAKKIQESQLVCRVRQMLSQCEHFPI